MQASNNRIIWLRRFINNVNFVIAAQFYDLYYIFFCWYYSFGAYCVNKNEETKFILNNILFSHAR